MWALSCRRLWTIAVVAITLHIIGTTAQSLGQLKKMPRPPEMMAGPPQLAIYKIGEDLMLECKASGEPAPTYRWERNAEHFDIDGQDNRVTQQPNVGTIVFNNPLKKDEGVYQCFAENQHGTAATQIVVLISSQLDAFPESRRPDIYTVGVGESLMLSCIPPKSIPSKLEISWEKYYSTGEIEPVILSNRISIDSYGNLYFISIKKEDELRDNGEYRCSVFNNIERMSVSGMRYQIKINGDKAVSSAPEMMWATPDNRPVGLRGEKFILKCIFSGQPIPKVTWEKTSGGPMGKEPRVTTDSFGQELVFNYVEFSDAGRYECGGGNTQTANKQQKPFDFSVESKPFWVTKPQNKEVGEGDTVTFICKAEGIPKPDINWFINGKPLQQAPPNPRRYSLAGNVTYFDVRTTDAQVVQCNASNIYGYVFANAYLNVIRSEPIWKVPPPPNITFAEGQTKNLTCETYAGPRAAVSWVKDGVYLTGGRHVVHLDGNLEIQDIVTTDAGTYTCTAKNDKGQLVGTSIVRVAQPTQIVTAPEDLMVTAGKEAKFTCTAVTDPNQMNYLEIVWLKYNNQIEPFQSERVYQNLMDNSLTITDVNDQDAALYTCMARTNLDSARASAFLRVRDVPNHPEITEVKCKTNRTAENRKAYYAKIYFTPRGANYAPINKFDIEYSTNFDKDAWSVIASAETSNPIEIQLSPYATYTFRVIAWNFIGKSEPSPASEQTCTNDPEPPYVQPRNVKGEGTIPSNMIISWTPILPIDHNGAGFRYEIEWNCTDSDCDANDQRQSGQASKDDYNINTHVVEGLPTYHRYRIKVSCRNEVGLSTEVAVPVIGYSGESVPQTKPESFRFSQQAGVRGVNLTWSPVPNTASSVGGFLVGYVIKFLHPDDSLSRVRYQLIQLNDPEDRFNAPFTHEPHDATRRRRRRRSITLAELNLPEENLERVKREADLVSSSDNEVRVTMMDLPPNSKLVLSVAVFNTRYYGPFSDPITVFTNEGPPGPVDYFAVVRRNANMVKLEWMPPQDPNGKIIGYDFAHRELNGLNLGDRSWDNAVTDPSQRQHNISGLKPEQMYRIYIYGRTAAGRGEENFLDVSTTGAGAPMPPQFDVNNITDHTMNVTWVPSSKGNPGSVFYVQYRKSGRTEWEVSAIETNNLHVEIISLAAGTLYGVRVVAQNGYTAEAATPTKYYKTTGSTNSLSYVVGEPWFILLFLIVLILVVLLLVLLFCRDKCAKERPEEKEEQRLNEEPEFRPQAYPAGDYNKSHESVHEGAPMVDKLPEYRSSDHYYPEERAPRYSYEEKAPRYQPEEPRYRPEEEPRYHSEDRGPQYAREWERRPPYGQETRRAEPSPVSYLPERGAQMAPPSYNASFSHDEHNVTSTSTDV